MKTLIAYYSRAGHTASVAEKIQSFVGGDLFEIRGEKDYGNYFQALGIARKEFSEEELPTVVTEVEDFDSYDRILVGFPIWYSNCPQLVISFLTSHNCQGKDVYIFCTSGMSGPEKAMNQIRSQFPDLKLHSGVRFSKPKKEEVEAWLDGPAL